MWYIFKNKQCIASSDLEPNLEDLAERGEVAVEAAELYQLHEIEFGEGSQIVVKVPKVYVPTFEDKINALDAEYTSQFRELQQAWAAANLKDNTALAAEIQADYVALEAEYQSKREAIINAG